MFSFRQLLVMPGGISKLSYYCSDIDVLANKVSKVCYVTSTCFCCYTTAAHRVTDIVA